MNQRGKLQFVGADVIDDATNDKTIVTTTPQSMIGDAWVVSHAYAKDDYRIDGNVLYKCKTAHTSTASNRPPYASYWDAVSVASELKSSETILFDSGNLTSNSWTDQSQSNIYIYHKALTSAQIANIKKYIGFNKLYSKLYFTTSSGTSTLFIPMYYDASVTNSILGSAYVAPGIVFSIQMIISIPSNPDTMIMLSGDNRLSYKNYTYRYYLVGVN
jgi:hypothetical protein